LLIGVYYYFNDGSEKTALNDVQMDGECQSYELEETSLGEFNERLICFDGGGKRIVLEENIQDLFEEFEYGGGVGRFAFPDSSSVIYFKLFKPETPSGFGVYEYIPLSGETYRTDVKNLGSLGGGSLSPDETVFVGLNPTDQSVELTWKTLFLTDLISQKTEPVIFADENENFAKVDQGPCANCPTVDIAWLDNNTFSYGIFSDGAEHVNGERESLRHETFEIK